ncbi:hypothetical protein HAX54_039819 [Datura stramonium]|uniref:Uncharacterized protein n=1 Tax=Datura stramonium TaxID=4076 RepID=A0ABS8VNC4_DATST|nr:hypothetical protein [Datura stramonium]
MEQIDSVYLLSFMAPKSWKTNLWVTNINALASTSSTVAPTLSVILENSCNPRDHYISNLVSTFPAMSRHLSYKCNVTIMVSKENYLPFKPVGSQLSEGP